MEGRAGRLLLVWFWEAFGLVGWFCLLAVEVYVTWVTFQEAWNYDKMYREG